MTPGSPSAAQAREQTTETTSQQVHSVQVWKAANQVRSLTRCFLSIYGVPHREIIPKVNVKRSIVDIVDTFLRVAENHKNCMESQSPSEMNQELCGCCKCGEDVNKSGFWFLWVELQNLDKWGFAWSHLHSELCQSSTLWSCSRTICGIMINLFLHLICSKMWTIGSFLRFCSDSVLKPQLNWS